MTMHDIIVLKFGSSILEQKRDYEIAAAEIYRHLRRGRRVVAVVSALAGVTDDLLRASRSFSTEVDESSHVLLLATGELSSAAMLNIQLGRYGIPSVLADHHRINLRTRGPLRDSRPDSVDVAGLLGLLRANSVVVVPGFVGVNEDGRTSLLGRGGSDLTAVFLAEQLRAGRCVLIKDVNGMYDRDPNAPDRNQSPAHRFAGITFEEALALKTPLVQVQAIVLAKMARIPFEVTSPNSASATRIGAATTARDGLFRPQTPLRVALFGCGNVGRAVYEQLRHRRGEFEIVGVAVRDRKSHLDRGEVDPDLLTDADELIERDAEVVIELIGGVPLAGALVRRILHEGRHVVTANKELIAWDGSELSDLAAKGSGSLRYSAAVGGGVPMLEFTAGLARQGVIRSVVGTLNGTSNFVLSRLQLGQDLDTALGEARRLGCVESDASCDLSGYDAACKLCVLAREAFSRTLTPDEIDRQEIDEGVESLIRESNARGGTLRQIASCELRDGHLSAAVRLETLSFNDPLVPGDDAGNTLKILGVDGSESLTWGIGAGPWPTSISVMADLLDIARTEARRYANRPDCNPRVLPQEVKS